MASSTALTAIIERLVEKTKAKHPGIDIIKKPKEPKAPKPRKRRKKGCLSSSGLLH